MTFFWQNPSPFNERRIQKLMDLGEDEVASRKMEEQMRLEVGHYTNSLARAAARKRVTEYKEALRRLRAKRALPQPKTRWGDWMKNPKERYRVSVVGMAGHRDLDEHYDEVGSPKEAAERVAMGVYATEEQPKTIRVYDRRIKETHVFRHTGGELE